MILLHVDADFEQILDLGVEGCWTLGPDHLVSHYHLTLLLFLFSLALIPCIQRQWYWISNEQQVLFLEHWRTFHAQFWLFRHQSLRYHYISATHRNHLVDIEPHQLLCFFVLFFLGADKCTVKSFWIVFSIGFLFLFLRSLLTANAVHRLWVRNCKVICSELFHTLWPLHRELSF